MGALYSQLVLYTCANNLIRYIAIDPMAIRYCFAVCAIIVVCTFFRRRYAIVGDEQTNQIVAKEQSNPFQLLIRSIDRGLRGRMTDRNRSRWVVRGTRNINPSQGTAADLLSPLGKRPDTTVCTKPFEPLCVDGRTLNDRWFESIVKH